MTKNQHTGENTRRSKQKSHHQQRPLGGSRPLPPGLPLIPAHRPKGDEIPQDQDEKSFFQIQRIKFQLLPPVFPAATPA